MRQLRHMGHSTKPTTNLSRRWLLLGLGLNLALVVSSCQLGGSEQNEVIFNSPSETIANQPQQPVPTSAAFASGHYTKVAETYDNRIVVRSSIGENYQLLVLSYFAQQSG